MARFFGVFEKPCYSDRMNNKTFRAIISFAGVLAVLLLGSCSASGSDSPATTVTAGHSSVEAFTSLSASQRMAVKNLKIFFQHASVGNNLYEGIADLASTEANCDIARKQILVENGETLATIRTWLASNSGWGDYYLGNPGWSEKIAAFGAAMDSGGIGSVADVAMMKLCFIDNAASFADYRDAMLSLEKRFPSVTFVWWTMPICTNDNENMDERDAFNAAARKYVSANGKWLFDLADIECHDSLGIKQTDADGFERLCDAYASDSSGHLNETGRDRAAKAMWVLLAAIAESK